MVMTVSSFTVSNPLEKAALVEAGLRCHNFLDRQQGVGFAGFPREAGGIVPSGVAVRIADLRFGPGPLVGGHAADHPEDLAAVRLHRSAPPRAAAVQNG